MDEEYSASSSAGGGGAGVGGKKAGKQHNTLPFWGNETSMNLNPLILANIQSSSYFKVHLFKLKTYHEVVDEIYYQVKHMEPWERGSRKTSGQTGMCGGVRGVGAGGIVSTAYCLLYKLYTLRLTRKQINGLLNHTDSAYIRALGFMYLRYTQPPGDLYDWYEDYLQDEEEIDVKAGGGQVMTIGQMVYQFMTKLDWFSTLFPRIPVPIQKQIERKIGDYCREQGITLNQLSSGRPVTGPPGGGAGAAAATAATAGPDDDYQEYHESGNGGGHGHAGGDRGGGGGRGGRGGGQAMGGFGSRHGVGGYPPINYRNDHDDRDYYATSSSSSYARGRGYEDYPPALPSAPIPYHSSGDRDRERVKDRDHDRDRLKDHDRQRSKHKKKHKHRHYSRSRSRSPSRNRHRSERHDRKRDAGDGGGGADSGGSGRGGFGSERSSKSRHNDHPDDRERDRERERRRR
ncbi:pre-mRNA-splicing factor 38B isoform X1 [Drosophila miranda]|uniref:pre-mRNA-splicing factor 38B isoform X1 n=2 Tax=Drosophila miranda TaxID=7229 RepID=UPI0007E68220|nr:pre-mRNA-splicing factor 38B isoform X1 [Drosophila miranda]